MAFGQWGLSPGGMDGQVCKRTQEGLQPIVGAPATLAMRTIHQEIAGVENQESGSLGPAINKPVQLTLPQETERRQLEARWWASSVVLVTKIFEIILLYTKMDCNILNS